VHCGSSAHAISSTDSSSAGALDAPSTMLSPQSSAYAYNIKLSACGVCQTVQCRKTFRVGDLTSRHLQPQCFGCNHQFGTRKDPRLDDVVDWVTGRCRNGPVQIPHAPSGWRVALPSGDRVIGHLRPVAAISD
jgi:hypothetical protein